MKATLQVVDPDSVRVRLGIEASVGELRQMREDLDMRSTPSLLFYGLLNEVIAKAEKHFWEEKE